MLRIYALIVLLVAGKATAQDLEPRFLSAIPIGGNFVIASYGYSSGNILLDNTLPVEDLNARIHNIVGAYARSFKLFNKLVKFDAVIPYAFGHFTGVVSEVDSSTSRNGFGDPLLRFSVILAGAKPLGPGEFTNYEQKKFKFGANVRLKIPLGQYDPTKLINLGANRWAVKLGVSGSYTLFKKLILEGHFNSWFFTENKKFFNGNTIEQKPLLSVQIHVTWVFKPGMWIAGSFGTSGLGETTINGVEKNDKKNNLRYGAAFAYRLNKHHAIKIAFSSGVTTRYGADFTTVLIAYQLMWFDKKNK